MLYWLQRPKKWVQKYVLVSKIQDRSLNDLILWLLGLSVDSLSFRNMFTLFQSKFTFAIKKADFFRSHVMTLYEIEREKMKTFLNLYGESKFSFSTDCWTSLNKLGIICNTAPFLKYDFTMLNSLLLEFIPLEKAHAGEHLLEMFLESLCSFNLESKNGTITMDNA